MSEQVSDRGCWQSILSRATYTENPKMKEAINKAIDVSLTRTTVLIMGETGVGKGVMARLIHDYSNRKKGPFVQVHCGAITETLIESEFFGHEKGSFTGATKRKLGKFELAHCGTIFLDEISTLSPPAQIRLLQILQEGFFHRVGGEEDVRVDIRVIAACNEDLKLLVEAGMFRRDLYYRLNVFPILIPSLRERPEDLENIIQTLLTRLKQIFHKEINGISPEALGLLKAYSWPGNIRELENLIERAFIVERGNRLSPNSFPPEITHESPALSPALTFFDQPLAQSRLRVLEDFEKQYLSRVLTLTKGRIIEAAEIAGVGPRQFNKLMKKYSLYKNDFKLTKENNLDLIISNQKIKAT